MVASGPRRRGDRRVRAERASTLPPMRVLRSLLSLLPVACLASAALAGPAFTVTFDAALRDQPATGRLVVYLVREGSGIHQDPAEGPFWEDPQPLFGIDVKDLAPGAAATVNLASWTARV